MELVIHRGTHEIGGSCIELQHDGCRIVLDLGKPLMGRGADQDRARPGDGPSGEMVAAGLLPPVKGLYSDDEPGVAALLVTHAHLDHSGLLPFVHKDIPVRMSEGTRGLLKASSIFIRGAVAAPSAVPFESREPFEIGPFRITAHLVDHSAPDAVAFEIEAGGKKVFYSGDLRAHGRKSKLFKHMLAPPPKDVDVMLLEGTMVGSSGGRSCADEEAVESELVDIFKKKTSIALVFCSGQNLDRIVSIYRAVLQADCTMVIDLYTAYVLESSSELSQRLPAMDKKGIEVFHWGAHKEALEAAGEGAFLDRAEDHAIGTFRLNRDRERMVFLARSNSFFHRALKRFENLSDVEMIWSMWGGYLREPKNPVARFAREHNLDIRQVHTSGHATVDDLRALAEAVAPGVLVPVHTTDPEGFSGIYDRAQVVADGEVMDV
jgi:ribonuclease J